MLDQVCQRSPRCPAGTKTNKNDDEDIFLWLDSYTIMESHVIILYRFYAVSHIHITCVAYRNILINPFLI